jgi:hypothetical protein
MPLGAFSVAMEHSVITEDRLDHLLSRKAARCHRHLDLRRTQFAHGTYPSITRAALEYHREHKTEHLHRQLPCTLFNA